MSEEKFTGQDWDYLPAACACCVLNPGDADWEFRSIGIARDDAENPAAMAVYDGSDVEDLDWGVHKRVVSGGGGSWVLSDTSLVAPVSVNFPEPNLDGRGSINKVQYRWVVEPRGGLPWRAMDGPGLAVEWAVKREAFAYNSGDGTYEDPVITFDGQSDTIAVSEGETTVYGATQDLVADEGERLTLVGPIREVPFEVNGYIAAEPAAQTFSGHVTLLANFYAERKGATTTALELTLQHHAEDFTEVEITWSQRTVDRDGVQIGGIGAGNFTLEDTSPHVATVAAPAGDGRIYCYDFHATEVEPSTLPVLVPTQESPELP